jgi:hypothetical protein
MAKKYPLLKPEEIIKAKREAMQNIQMETG